MKYREYAQQLEAEINALNWRIDEKILRGLSYAAEARRHRALIRQMRRERHSPVFSRLFAAVSLF